MKIKLLAIITLALTLSSCGVFDRIFAGVTVAYNTDGTIMIGDCEGKGY